MRREPTYSPEVGCWTAYAVEAFMLLIFVIGILAELSRSDDPAAQKAAEMRARDRMEAQSANYWR